MANMTGFSKQDVEQIIEKHHGKRGEISAETEKIVMEHHTIDLCEIARDSKGHNFTQASATFER
jgi:hypothetical protein